MIDDLRPERFPASQDFLRHKGTVLYVEGTTDKKVFQKFVAENCKIDVCHGKKMVIDVMRKNCDDGVIGIVDLDFDFLTDENLYDEIEGLFVTDAHDLDCEIFYSKALEHVVLEFGNLKRIEARGFLQIRRRLIDAICYLSYCRLASERHNLCLKFKDLDYGFILKSPFMADKDKLINNLIKNSRDFHGDATSLKELIEYERQKTHSDQKLHNGHDLATALGVSLQDYIGNRGDTVTREKEIASDLRLAYDFEMFSGTRLYLKIKEWEKKTQSFPIFREGLS